MKKIIVSSLVALFLTTSINVASARHLEKVYRDVNAGETIQSIAEDYRQYMTTTDKREFAEFVAGIEEINWNTIGNRPNHNVKKGDTLQINLWVND